MSLRPEIAQPHDAESMAELHFLSHTVSFANFASPEWVKSRERDDYLKQWNTFLQDAQSDDRSQAWKVSANNAVVGMVKVSRSAIPKRISQACMSIRTSTGKALGLC